MKVSQTLADKRRIEQNIRGRGLIFRRLFRQVVIAQESRVLQRISSIIKPTLSNVMDREYENKTIALAMRPFYIATITDSASEIFKEFPEPEPEFEKTIDPMDALDADIFKYANRYSIAMAKYVNKTTAKKIKRIVQEGLKERLHYSEITKNIKNQIFKDLREGVRARRLAHTEAHGMVENGRSKGAKANKVIKTKTWSAAADARETHGDANGQTVLKNDTFIVGGYKMEYPGDTSYGAGLEEIINCRCSALYSSRIDKKKLTTSKELLARHEEKLRLPKLPKAPKLETTLKSGKIGSTTTKGFDKGANQTVKIHIEGDGDACFKSVDGENVRLLARIGDGTMAERERAAYLISKEMGLNNVPVTVLRKIKGKLGSAQYWVEKGTAEVAGHADYAKLSVYMKKNQDMLKVKMEIFDALIDNTDRHAGNFLIGKEKLFYIDNGFSLPGAVSKYGRASWIEDELVELTKQVRKYLTRGDVTEYIAKLKRVKASAILKGEMTKLHLEAEYRYMIERGDLIIKELSKALEYVEWM